MKITKLPPSYSEADQAARAYLMEKLAELDRAYRRDAQPILADLAAIDARYAPRYVLAPEDEAREESGCIECGGPLPGPSYAVCDTCLRSHAQAF